MPAMKFLFRTLALSLLTTVLGFTACTDDDAADDTVQNANANVGHEGASYVRTEAGTVSSAFADRLEMPRLQQGDVFIVHQATDMRNKPVNYAVAYLPADHHSRWVAFRFDNIVGKKGVDKDGKPINRKDYSIRPQYPQDPLCASTPIDDASFRGYDHGHLCASADRVCSRIANDQTFYMSNMSPQISSFNQNYWVGYEKYVRTLGNQCGVANGSNPSFADTLYVVKGGTTSLAKTTIKVESYHMPVPDYYYIALLAVKNGSYAAIGFWMQHKSYDIDMSKAIDYKEIAAHAVSIDRLEQLTGIDFFCNLPDRVEDAVEQQCITSAWGL